MATVCVPRVSFDVPSVTLPFGIEMQGFADFSKGPPSQCQMLSSLMVQIMPAMAAFSPIIKILGVLQAVEGLVKLPPDITGFLAKLNAVLSLIDPLPMISAVKSILLLVITYLNCFIQSMTNVLALQAQLELSIASAAGNPDLLASLQCASGNVSVSIQQLMLSLGPLAPLMELIQPLMGIAGLSFALPSFSSSAGAQSTEEIEQTLQTLSKTLTDLQQVLENIKT
jgi:hypothetical protein